MFARWSGGWIINALLVTWLGECWLDFRVSQTVACLFYRLFCRSLARSFVCRFLVGLFVCSLIRLSIHPSVSLFLHFVRSFVRSLVHLSAHLDRSLLGLFVRKFLCSFVCPSARSVINWSMLTSWMTGWFTGPLIKWIVCQHKTHMSINSMSTQDPHW